MAKSKSKHPKYIKKPWMAHPFLHPDSVKYYLRKMKSASTRNWKKMDIEQLVDELEEQVKWRTIPHDTLHSLYYDWAIPKLKELICNVGCD
jgi:hypothetical protein